jgi:hypothetical protein
MQSVLQYRRFEKHLREQIQRHGLDRTSGIRGRILGQATPAAEPKDVKAGPTPLVARRDHVPEEKETSDHDPIPPQQDEPVFENAASVEENLSGSTTRSSSTFTADSLRPDLRTATTQDTTGEPFPTTCSHGCLLWFVERWTPSLICFLFVFQTPDLSEK